MKLADSIACDPHKWLYAPIDAGVTLVREPGLLNEAFAFQAAYLRQVAEPGRVDLVDRTPENTRGFRALKVWLALQAYGREGYRQMIEWNIQVAAYMEKLIDTTPGVVKAAPRELSIVCWRCEPERFELDSAQLEALQWEVIQELERRGIALVSNTRLHDGSTALRCCIVNFRTQGEHVERLVRESAAIGEEIAARIATHVA
jgi:glutamate/tyrosine decarboxylase-like PLP-dependent enzyme